MIRRLAFVIFLFGIVALPALFAQEWSVYDWEVPLSQAREEAAEEDKELLYFFAGSDWCSWCDRLITEVFSQELFRSFESSHVVPVLIDFPRQRELPPALQARNAALLEEFGVEGFPTIVILTPEGEEKFRTGYRPGGPSPYINHLLPHVR